jgi:hypothetical protein
MGGGRKRCVRFFNAQGARPRVRGRVRVCASGPVRKQEHQKQGETGDTKATTKIYATRRETRVMR